MILMAPAAAVCLGLGIMASLEPPEPQTRMPYLRLGALTLAVVCGFLFDDAAQNLTNPVPHSFRVRRLIRIVSGIVAAGSVATLAVAIGSRGMDVVWTIPEPTEDTVMLSTPFPAGRVALETAAMLLVAFATAAVLSRSTRRDPGKVTAPTLLGMYAASWMIPETHNPWPYPTDERWSSAATWWWIVLAAATIVAVLSSGDPRRKAGSIMRSIARPSREMVRWDGQEREMTRNENRL
jgi:hypothetical protein